MSGRRPPPKDEPPAGIPPYMVSFADMMTNMLCFFILLCAFAETKRSGFVAAGLGSFREAIDHLGLPGLLTAERTSIRLDAPKVQFQVPKVVPINKEHWRKPHELEQMSDNQSLPQTDTQSTTERQDLVIPTGLVFPAGSSRLGDEARPKLEALANLIRRHQGTIEIEGHTAPGEAPDGKLLGLSLRRARAVQRLLAELSGVDAKNLRAVGYGASRTLVNRPQKGLNARVVLRFLR